MMLLFQCLSDPCIAVKSQRNIFVLGSDLYGLKLFLFA